MRLSLQTLHVGFLVEFCAALMLLTGILYAHFRFGDGEVNDDSNAGMSILQIHMLYLYSQQGYFTSICMVYLMGDNQVY